MEVPEESLKWQNRSDFLDFRFSVSGLVSPFMIKWKMPNSTVLTICVVCAVYMWIDLADWILWTEPTGLAKAILKEIKKYTCTYIKKYTCTYISIQTYAWDSISMSHLALSTCNYIHVHTCVHTHCIFMLRLHEHLFLCTNLLIVLYNPSFLPLWCWKPWSVVFHCFPSHIWAARGNRSMACQAMKKPLIKD